MPLAENRESSRGTWSENKCSSCAPWNKRFRWDLSNRFNLLNKIAWSLECMFRFKDCFNDCFNNGFLQRLVHRLLLRRSIPKQIDSDEIFPMDPTFSTELHDHQNAYLEIASTIASSTDFFQDWFIDYCLEDRFQNRLIAKLLQRSMIPKLLQRSFSKTWFKGLLHR